MCNITYVKNQITHNLLILTPLPQQFDTNLSKTHSFWNSNVWSSERYSQTIIIIIIGIQPLGRSGQRPEFSQATGMALVRCILGKFLGVACHCFPPAIQTFPLSTTRCLHVRHDVRDPSGGRGNCGRECLSGNFCRNDDFHAIQGSFTRRKSTTWDRRLYFRLSLTFKSQR